MCFYERAYTPLITLWYLLFQRLHPHHVLSQVQEDALAGGADRLSPKGKTLSQQLRSEATTSYSDARQRLPLSLCRRALRHTATQTSQTLPVPREGALRVGLLDGSTCRLRPFGDIPEQFVAHRVGNSRRAPYWCVARVVGLFCGATGVVLDSILDSPKLSEQALSACLLAASCWKGWLLVGDRNFGVYSVARAMQAARAQALLRLTESRARKLAQSAGRKLKPGLDVPLSWTPSSHDKCPEALGRTPIVGRLVAITVAPPGYRRFTLYLFTTLTDAKQFPAQELARIYAQRWKVELCFRYLKAQMDLDLLECHSAEMARKEWLAGLIAYNLIRFTMAAAAATAGVPVEWLSFSRARELLLGWYLRQGRHPRRVGAWTQLLRRIAKARLPKRRKPRPPELRAIRPFCRDFARLFGSRALARRNYPKTSSKS